MLVPLSWLRDYVPLPADPAALVERLTIAGLEASGVKVFGLPVPAGIRVKPEDAGPVWERDKVMVAQGAGDHQAPRGRQAQAGEARITARPSRRRSSPEPRTSSRARVA